MRVDKPGRLPLRCGLRSRRSPPPPRRRMTGFLSDLLTQYETALERHRHRPFLKATMAACALVATVDGVVSLGQRLRVDQILDTLEALKVFDPHEGVDLFNEHCEAIVSAPREGRREALRCVMHVAESNREKAELLVRICLAVSEADGAISLEEQIEIVSLCTRLGLNPSDFGLYSSDSAASVLAGIELRDKAESA